MTEQEILEKWQRDKASFVAWSQCIAEAIEVTLREKIHPITLDYFLKVPMVPRLKGDASLIDKALHRNKSYTDPYGEITDKVGMRYVVLLTSDIAKICAVIESPKFAELWTYSKDKDYEEERLAKPLEFSYQSVHYILRAKGNHKFGSIEVPDGLPCEVQIRTLLQHAHSELTHDTLYKPKTTAKPSVKRTVAKSMALIEATDEFFVHAMDELAAINAPQRDLFEYLCALYLNGTKAAPGRERSNDIVIDTFWDVLPNDVANSINRFLHAKPYVYERVLEQKGLRHFFNQPVVLLTYFLVNQMPARVKAMWPLGDQDLAKIFSDLGKSYDS